MENQAIVKSEFIATNPELFAFGCVADVQYADSADGYNYQKTHKRFYRNSLNLLNLAYREFEVAKCPFVLQLGDIIDGRCGRQGYEQRALKAVTDIIAAYERTPTVHVWGNHDLVCFKRSQLYQSSLRPPDETVCAIGSVESTEYNRPADCAYYAFTYGGVRFIALDVYERSVHGYEKDDPRYKLAESLIHEHNKNASTDWNHAKGLTRQQKRYVAYNGGVTEAQLHWFSVQCQSATQRGHRLVVFCHTPVHERSHPAHRRSVADSMCWDSEAICDIIMRDFVVPAHRSALILTGHTHHYGYYFQMAPGIKSDNTNVENSRATSRQGIYHLVLPGILECPPESGASHWIVRVYPSHFELDGSAPHVNSLSVRC